MARQWHNTVLLSILSRVMVRNVLVRNGSYEEKETVATPHIKYSISGKNDAEKTVNLLTNGSAFQALLLWPRSPMKKTALLATQRVHDLPFLFCFLFLNGAKVKYVGTNSSAEKVKQADFFKRSVSYYLQPEHNGTETIHR